jgi:tetratricopeptide (TPR) repeat protein
MKSQLWIGATALAFLAASGCQTITSGTNAQGVALMNQGNLDAAATRFRMAMENDPIDADAYYNLAVTHHHQWRQRKQVEDGQAAEMLYRQCLDRNPDHRECYRGLAMLMVDRGQSEAAFQLLSTWAARGTAHSDAKVELAKLYEDFNDQQQAIERYREAIEADPQNPRAITGLAQLQDRRGETQQALTNYQRSLEIDKSQQLVAARVATLQVALGVAPIDAAPNGTRLASAPQSLARY